MDVENKYASLDDEALVKAAQKGNKNAFEELVARHRDKVYGRLMIMIKNENDALDLSQEVWIKAWKRLKQFHGDSAFCTWVTRIAINVGVDHIRKQKRKKVESIEDHIEEGGSIERLMPIETVNPTQGLEREELRARIDKALEQLSPEHRSVVILHEFEGLEYKEIAKMMKCSMGTIMSRLFYARKKLASMLASIKKERLQ